eukprot:TRINITY_DN107448_c0_g1_i1.p1 TRINITY_DN107448_c0_g1~~TRINITY_DN107448_c0_g1_i1.p1  ORF type:complete len:682 (-),score=107.89 TRINITY_DN107448_c0_g1_i1:91-2088(-)
MLDPPNPCPPRCPIHHHEDRYMIEFQAKVLAIAKKHRAAHDLELRELFAASKVSGSRSASLADSQPPLATGATQLGPRGPSGNKVSGCLPSILESEGDTFLDVEPFERCLEFHSAPDSVIEDDSNGASSGVSRGDFKGPPDEEDKLSIASSDDGSQSGGEKSAVAHEDSEEREMSDPVHPPKQKRRSTWSKELAVAPMASMMEAEQGWNAEKEEYMKKQLKLVTEQSKLDLVAGIVIMLNTITMMYQMEWEGAASAVKLGVPGHEPWGVSDAPFLVLEHVFTAFYLGECSVRIYQEQTKYFFSIFNWFDLFLALLSTIENWVLQPILGGTMGGNLSELRILRVAKLVRVARIIRAVRLFTGLRQLVTACTSAFTALFWSVVLLSLCIVAGSLLIGNLLQDFIADKDADYDQRVWVWEHYGTSLRAANTLFDMTFAGNWPVYSRPVLKYVGGWYMICFGIYIVLVVFAATRIIGAIFLKEALDATTADPELMIQAKEAQRLKYMDKLKDFFNAIDTTGDGDISREELNTMLVSPKVIAYLSVLDIELHEGSKLFDMLDDGDGVVTYNEFINGLFRFRGQARSVDLIELHMRMQQMEDDLLEHVQKIEANIVGNLVSDLRKTQSFQMRPPPPKPPRRQRKRFSEMLHNEIELETNFLRAVSGASVRS